MDYLISFVVSVMTNIAAYIVRKWIDKQSHDKIKGRCTAIQRPFWCARQDSNLRPCESESHALSSCATSAYLEKMMITREKRLRQINTKIDSSIKRRQINGGQFVVRPPENLARSQIFKRYNAKNPETMPPVSQLSEN